MGRTRKRSTVRLSADDRARLEALRLEAQSAPEAALKALAEAASKRRKRRPSNRPRTQ